MNLPVLQNRYRVIQVLSDRGGFGITYLAEDTQMPSGRRCVIKQLRPINSDPQLYQMIKERFQREAVILEQLGHNNPQIPELYAYFEESGQFYLVEELIEGVTLTQKMQQDGKLSESIVKGVVTSILPVIEYIHSYRIIHRDIKPDNIILRYGDNLPVLLDFGAVKETMGTVMTASGNFTSSIVIGTAGFMPSEQSAGRPVFASDLYSLGLTAIYLLTGKLPHDLNTDVSTGEIIWRQQALNVGPSFGNILDKVVHSHPRDRYLNSREMLEALRTSSGAYHTPMSPTTTQASPLNNPINPQNSPKNPQIIPQVAATQISRVGANNNNNNYPKNQSPPSQDNPTVIASPQNQLAYQYQQPIQQTSSPVKTGLKNWQKAVITGSIAGTVIMGALLANNVLHSSNSNDNDQAKNEQATTINSPDGSSQTPLDNNSSPTPTSTPNNTPNVAQTNPTPTATPIQTPIEPSNQDHSEQPKTPPTEGTTNSTPVSNNTSIGQSEAVNVISKWQEYKRKIMGQSHEIYLGSEILTGKAYQDNIERSDGQDSSSQWLVKNSSYYTYGVQQIDSVSNFVANGDRATIDAVVTEQRTLYKANGTIDRKASSYDKRLVRYNLRRDNGVWKIADYNTVKVIWKK